jgi:non-specific serine/threonine protein kinase/serine/threonine-protein kinase
VNMDTERQQKIEQICREALTRSEDERSIYLAEACGDDGSLLTEVTLLVASHLQSRTLLENPAHQAKIDLRIGDLQSSLAGTAVGPYQIAREVGRGGMGVVCLAIRADNQFQQQVAIKLVKRGMDTDFILNRFRNERQILANLNHPNIARLLDGGMTDGGLPFFIMEYIAGTPIDDYCDAHRLTITARLKLFRTVCSAVSYAHQNLVVHRDIKPSNILVTSEGIPKLLDFGIAKLLHPVGDQTGQTLTEQRVMTPEYASPEQVRGEPITTATDVYLLGILLYELLTGHRPYRFTTRRPDELLKVICEQQPERPSTVIGRVVDASPHAGSTKLTPELVSQTREGQPQKLRRRLSGDLDNIVMKALQKDPTRRYGSVEQFSEDVSRHLAGLPVMARKDTLSYRAAKFVRRHRAGVGAAVLLTLSLLGGLFATLWQARVARIERARAERRFNDVRQLANSFMFEIHDAIEMLPGSTKPRELLVKRALEYLDSLVQEGGNDLSLQHELARSYLKVGDVQGYPLGANLGDSAGALASYRKSLLLCESLVAASPRDANFRKDLLVSHERMGDTLIATGDTAKALEHHRKALEISKALSAEDPSDFAKRRTLSISYVKLGEALSANGDRTQALEAFRLALEIADSRGITDKTAPEDRRLVTVICVKLGELLAQTDDVNASLTNYRRALALREQLAREDPNNAQAKRDLAASFEKLASLMANRSEISKALGYQRQAMKIDEMLAAADPANVDAQLDLAISHSNIAELLALAGQSPLAQQGYRDALKILENLSQTNPSNTEIRFTLADDTVKLGHSLMDDGQIANADHLYQQGVAIFEALVTADPSNADFRNALAACCQKIGELHARAASRDNIAQNARLRLWRTARSWFQKSLDVWISTERRNDLIKADDKLLESLRQKIETCDAALVRN